MYFQQREDAGASIRIALELLVIALSFNPPSTQITLKATFFFKAYNSLPRITFAFAPGEEEIFMDIIKEQQEIITKEYHKTDANMSIEGFLESSTYSHAG